MSLDSRIRGNDGEVAEMTRRVGDGNDDTLLPQHQPPSPQHPPQPQRSPLPSWERARVRGNGRKWGTSTNINYHEFGEYDLGSSAHHGHTDTLTLTLSHERAIRLAKYATTPQLRTSTSLTCAISPSTTQWHTSRRPSTSKKTKPASGSARNFPRIASFTRPVSSSSAETMTSTR